jgi:L-threonylcarbamoyladenylate synthase
MTTLISESELHLALQALREGQLVAFPTETVYGLAALAQDEDAVQALYEAKVRPAHMAMPVMIASPEMIPAVALPQPEFWILAEHFWPGPLTIILTKSKLLPDVVTAGSDTVGLRIPNHPLALELLRLANTPLAVTSANRSGYPPARTAEEARRQLEGRVHYVVDGGLAAGGHPSTILSLTQEPPCLLRRGPIDPETIARVLKRNVESIDADC